MITSETFYRAECDHAGCDRSLPDDDNEEGASHWPRDVVVKALGEERGEHDETWTVVGEQTFCPRHAPGVAECTACDGLGYFRTPDNLGGVSGWAFSGCPVCGSRGYIIPAEPEGQATT